MGVRDQIVSLKTQMNTLESQYLQRKDALKLEGFKEAEAKLLPLLDKLSREKDIIERELQECKSLIQKDQTIIHDKKALDIRFAELTKTTNNQIEKLKKDNVDLQKRVDELNKQRINLELELEKKPKTIVI